MVPDRVRDSSWGGGLFTKPLNAISSQAISVWQDSYKSPSWEELLQPLLPEYHAWASLMAFLTVRLHYSDLWSVPLQSRGHSLIIHVTHMADCPGPGTELEPTGRSLNGCEWDGGIALRSAMANRDGLERAGLRLIVHPPHPLPQHHQRGNINSRQVQQKPSVWKIRIQVWKVLCPF